MRKLVLLSLFLLLAGAVGAFAQDEKPADPAPKAPGEEAPVTGGVTYEPETGEDDKLREPFKSPFEIEQEDREALNLQNAALKDKSRLPYSISELELRGIYYQAKSGYRAIFRVGDDYKWWSAGTKFQDADLVNITDGAVVFKHYTSDEDVQVREVVKELHRGEE
jgi:Tfp pilus assembly protein PilP